MAACPIPRVMASLPTAPEVRIGNLSRHFQQYNTPSIVACAPQLLHLRLISVTPRQSDLNRSVSKESSLPAMVHVVSIDRTTDTARGRATHSRMTCQVAHMCCDLGGDRDRG
jgi:hypothetical protein